MREALRLAPTAPARGVIVLEDTHLANGKYFVKAGTPIVVNTWVYQKDPKVWGDDVRGNHFSSVRFLMQLYRPMSSALREC